MGKNNRRKKKKTQLKNYVLKCDTGHFYIKDQDQIAPHNRNRIYSAKDEEGGVRNPSGELLALVQLKLWLESQTEEWRHYFKTYPLENEPPKPAEYLAYLFLPKVDREILLGDLTEEYPSVVAKFGKRGAQVYFYKQVFWSIWPLVKKSAIKWALFGWVVELIRRMGS